MKIQKLFGMRLSLCGNALLPFIIRNSANLIFLCLASATPGYARLSVQQLQCEYQTDPLGIDELNPRLGWRLSSDSSKRQTAFRILVSSTRDALQSGQGELWDSGKVQSSATQSIVYDGVLLEAFQNCYWKVMTWDENNEPSKWSDVATFTVGPLETTDWPAEWIGPQRDADKSNFPIVFKQFPLGVLPQQALMFVNTLGYYELYVNGKKVSDDILSPAVSDYSRNTLYTTYDIAPYLQSGLNTIALWLAHGWYRTTPDRKYYGVVEDVPLARAFARLTYSNGGVDTISTNRSWNCRPSNRSYIGLWQWGNFGGERVDLSQVPDLSSETALNASRAANYIVHEIPARAQRNNPTRIIGTVEADNFRELGKRDYLVDFGKHLTGWLRLEFDGSAADSEVSLEYIDKLLKLDSVEDAVEKQAVKPLLGEDNNEGFISYNQKDVVIPARSGKEVFQNKFNYHAFRWIRLTGLDRDEILSLKALQISEANEQISTFESSNERLNKIWNAVVNTYRCINYNGYAVDCPHRERLGYGGDSHSSMETAMSIFDMAALGNKWTLDWNDSQYPTGLWPHTAPAFSGHLNKFSPGWGGFGLFLPWQFYQYYGDTAILEQAYPFIKRWIEYLVQCTEDGILKDDPFKDEGGFGAFHGDWVAPYYGMMPGERVDQDSTNFFNNCYYLYQLDLAKQIATVLGKPEDADAFRDLYAASASIIHEKFFDTGKHWYTNGEQPYQAFPLLIGLPPAALRPGLEHLMEHLIVEKNNGHLNTGMLGTYFMLEYLMQADRGDLIYMMANQPTFPGWGYMVENGATTIWEQWNGDNSQIHNCYLAIGKWFIQGLGGIRTIMEKPGRPCFVIDADYISELEFVNTSYDTRFGKFISNWNHRSGSIHHELLIPVNTRATYTIQQGEWDQVHVNGKLVERLENGAIELAPGHYEITIKE